MGLPEESIDKDVIASVLGATWKIREAPMRDVLALVQRYGVPELVARILVARGVVLEQVETFLDPTLRGLMQDPFHFKDMDKAVDRMAVAVRENQQIAVFGDYDVDGATSSSLIIRFLRMLGYRKDVISYIPDRIAEGYGPNAEAMKALKSQGVDLCITVDCGTAAIEALDVANEIGLDVVVLDHHLGGEQLPKACAVVNPNRLDETSQERHLAAVGVTFYFLAAVRSYLLANDYLQAKQVDLLSLLDLVALGTVCDVVPLKGVNRAFVAQGLKVMRRRQNVGINALVDVAGVDDLPSAYQLGYVIGPRVNAGGRVGESALGTSILSSESESAVYELAQKLNLYNQERRALEAQVLDEAMAQVENLGDEPLVFVKGEGWHPGVIGIVASRIKDHTKRPVAVISTENGVGKASARSVVGVDFGAAVVAANQAGLLVAGGGHAMAAGFTVEEDKVEDLYEFLNERMAPQYDEQQVRSMSFDGYLSVSAITTQLCEELEKLEPYGVGNAEPRFVLTGAKVLYVDTMGESHIRCTLCDSGAGENQSRIRAVAFRCVDTELGQHLLSSKGKSVTFFGKVRLNRWQGRYTPEFYIDDMQA